MLLGPRIAVLACWFHGSAARTCPGKLHVPGYGNVSFVNARHNTADRDAGIVEIRDWHLVPHMWGRSYFSNACMEDRYHQQQYAAFRLLGKTLRYSVNLHGQGCGCNVAFYLVSMRQNPLASDCCDHYCDASSVCGVNCAEIDIQEANRFAWHSMLHEKGDKTGTGSGYGGGFSDWPDGRYGPGANCIDTTAPFVVQSSFPVDSNRQLISVDVVLSQNGCEVSLSVAYHDVDKMRRLTRALEVGMTPVVSLWKDTKMNWLDKGPCDGNQEASQCSNTAEFYDLSVRDIEGNVDIASVEAEQALEAASAEALLARRRCAGPREDCRCVRCCERSGTQCYEKDRFWTECKAQCAPGVHAAEEQEFQTKWSCNALGPRTTQALRTDSGNNEQTLDASARRKTTITGTTTTTTQSTTTSTTVSSTTTTTSSTTTSSTSTTSSTTTSSTSISTSTSTSSTTSSTSSTTSSTTISTTTSSTTTSSTTSSTTSTSSTSTSTSSTSTTSSTTRTSTTTSTSSSTSTTETTSSTETTSTTSTSRSTSTTSSVSTMRATTTTGNTFVIKGLFDSSLA